jgi:hypothetical protein
LDLLSLLPPFPPPAKAQELMIFGYFEEVVEKLGNEDLAACVRDLLQHKFID